MNARALRMLVLGAVGSTLFGCTLLVSFDDKPDAGQALDEDPVDSGRTSSSSSSSSGSSSGSSSSGDVIPPVEAAAPFPPACDPAFDLTTVGCGDYIRAECNDEPQITGAALVDGDLIDCNAASEPTCVRHCPHGCVSMPQGFPDQCDDCDGRADGSYCMKDLRNSSAANDGFLVHCVGGNAASRENCATGETTACATTCAAGGADTPSCCE